MRIHSRIKCLSHKRSASSFSIRLDTLLICRSQENLSLTLLFFSSSRIVVSVSAVELMWTSSFPSLLSRPPMSRVTGLQSAITGCWSAVSDESYMFSVKRSILFLMYSTLKRMPGIWNDGNPHWSRQFELGRRVGKIRATLHSPRPSSSARRSIKAWAPPTCPRASRRDSRADYSPPRSYRACSSRPLGIPSCPAVQAPRHSARSLRKKKRKVSVNRLTTGRKQRAGESENRPTTCRPPTDKLLTPVDHLSTSDSCRHLTGRTDRDRTPITNCRLLLWNRSLINMQQPNSSRRTAEL